MPIKLDEQIGTKFPMDPIVLPEIKKMVENYRSGSPDDTRSGWISIYELMDLISDNNANGVRFYFARHNADAPVDIAGKLTVVFAATRDEKNPGKPTSENSVSLLKETKDADEDASSVIAHIILKEGDGDYTNAGGDAIPLCPNNCPPDPDPLD